MPNKIKQIKQTLRKNIKAKRNALNQQQISSLSWQLNKQAQHCQALYKAKNIATYQAAYGEIDPCVIQQSFRKTDFFIPKIINYPMRLMRFVPLSTAMKNNRFGIKEAKTSAQYFNAQHLDVILLPLIAFDSHGNRLGMGGGFYDRVLQFKTYQKTLLRPRLVGLAYDFQQCESLPTQAWDVPLDAIITNSQLIHFNK